MVGAAVMVEGCTTVVKTVAVAVIVEGNKGWTSMVEVAMCVLVVGTRTVVVIVAVNADEALEEYSVIVVATDVK